MGTKSEVTQKPPNRKPSLWRSFTSPGSDDASHRQWLLNVLLAGITIITLVVLVGAFILRPPWGTLDQDDTLLYISLVAMLGATAVIYAMNRWLSVDVAAASLLLLLTALAAVSDTPEQVYGGRGLIVFTIPILAASLLLRPRASFVFAALSSLVVVLVGMQNKHSVNIPAIGIFFVLALVSWLYARRQEQITRALRESEERFRATFDQAAVGIAHVAVDGQWLRVNQRLCDIVGYTPDELITKTFQEITHPDDLETDLGYVRQVLAGEIHTYSMEKRYIRKDSSLVWINLTVSLVRASTGEPKYFIAVIEDITGRKQAEEKLASLNAELRALFAAMQDVVLIIDRDGIYRKIAPTNPSLLYHPPEELLGKSLNYVFPAEEAEKFLAVTRRGLKTKQIEHIEYELTIGERHIWFAASITPMTEDATVWVAHDITNRKISEAALKRQLKEILTLNKVTEAGNRADMGWLGLPARPQRRTDPIGGAHICHCGRVRRPDLRSPLSQGVV